MAIIEPKEDVYEFIIWEFHARPSAP